jgi:hypothetical protein
MTPTSHQALEQRRGHRLDIYPDDTRNSAAVEMILARTKGLCRRHGKNKIYYFPTTS